MATVVRTEAAVELNLIKGFELRAAGQSISVKPAAQRLLAFLALHGGELRRSFIAGSLWLDSSERRANANLRSSLWRLQETSEESGVDLVESSSCHMRLADDVHVDLTESVHIAESILRGGDAEVTLDDEQRLRCDVLPDWYDDWVTLERERYRQLRLHALEELCGRYVAQGHYGCAINLGLTIVHAEPLRESAHRRVIESHLAEGNRSEARRQYERLADLLADNLGLAPSPALAALAFAS